MADWASADPERVLVELMYRFLFEPTPHASPNIHGVVAFQNLTLTSKGRFLVPSETGKGPNEVNQMPNGHELCAIARTQLGLFSNEREDKRLIQLLKASLPG